MHTGIDYVIVILSFEIIWQLSAYYFLSSKFLITVRLYDIFIIRNLRIFMQCELFIKASCILYIQILATSHPSLLQQNPGVWLQELSNKPLFEDNILFQNPILHQLNIWCV